MLTNPRVIRKYIFLCFVVYFSSYLTRINFGAIISEIVVTENFLNSSISLIITSGLFCYGIGQIIFGVFLTRVSSHKLVFYGLCATAFFNFIIPFCQTIAQWSVVWSLNGLAQSMIWTPLLRNMSETLSLSDYRKSCVTVSLAASIGTVFVYLSAPLLIVIDRWQLVFISYSIFTLIISGVWLVNSSKARPNSNSHTHDIPITPQPSRVEIKKELNRKSIYFPGLVILSLGVFIQGSIRDGLTVWIPSYISDSFKYSTTFSIFITVVLPIASIISVLLISYLHKHWFQNELSSSALFYLIGFVSLYLLSAVGSENVLFSMVLASITVAMIHGVNYMLIVLLPSRFVHPEKISIVSGILNFVTYLGSAISTYCIAVFSEILQWRLCLAILSGLMIIGAILCWIIRKDWSPLSRIERCS